MNLIYDLKKPAEIRKFHLSGVVLLRVVGYGIGENNLAVFLPILNDVLCSKANKLLNSLALSLLLKVG